MAANESYFDLFRRREAFYFKYQPHELNFADWISVLTLCLAPLVAHIFVGAPAPVVLAGKGPRWHDRMLLLNPTTIYWRYYAIRCRRARKLKGWGGEETAATSAIFWVNDRARWDGSERMIMASKIYIAKRPAPQRCISLVSVSAVQTLVVSLQGAQALYILVKGIRLGGFALLVSLASIFQPLAIAGLFRLPSAMFLTDDFRYIPTESRERASSAPAIMLTATSKPTRATPEVSPASPHPQRKSMSKSKVPELLRNQNDWRAIFWEISFLLSTAGLLGLASWYFKPNPRITAGTYSTLLINIFYVFFLVVTLGITLVYTVRCQNDTTIIPCITSPFYKAYTCLLFFLAFLVTILTALETRKTACGVYTTYPESLGWDHYVCPK